MFELIVIILFVIGLAGLLFILVRKLPALNSLPQNGSSGLRRYKFITEVENRVKEIVNFFEKQIFLHKLLSWLKVMVLKIETQIDRLLQKIRRKAQEK